MPPVKPGNGPGFLPSSIETTAAERGGRSVARNPLILEPRVRQALPGSLQRTQQCGRRCMPPLYNLSGARQAREKGAASSAAAAIVPGGRGRAHTPPPRRLRSTRVHRHTPRRTLFSAGNARRGAATRGRASDVRQGSFLPATTLLLLLPLTTDLLLVFFFPPFNRGLRRFLLAIFCCPVMRILFGDDCSAIFALLLRRRGRDSRFSDGAGNSSSDSLSPWDGRFLSAGGLAKGDAEKGGLAGRIAGISSGPNVANGQVRPMVEIYATVVSIGKLGLGLGGFTTLTTMN